TTVTQQFTYTPTADGDYYGAGGVLTEVNSNDLVTDGSKWYTNPLLTVNLSQNNTPTVDATTITWEESDFYPNKLYEITAEYNDPDGREDIKYARLQLNHPTGFDNSVTLQWNNTTREFYAWDLDSSKNNVETYVDTVLNVISEDLGQTGYRLTWQFALKPNWFETETGIKVGIQVEDKAETSSEWTYTIGDHGYILPEYGVTVLSHGFNPGRDVKNGQLINMTSLAEAIVKKAGKGRILYYDKNDGLFKKDIFDLTDYINTSDGETVLIFDWERESNNDVRGYSESAADALFSALIKAEQNSQLALDNLHLIGHSRGTVVTSELAERLNYYGYEIDQVTYLDPHDWGWTGFEGEGGFADDQDVNLESLIINYPQGTLPNKGVIAWGGDTYYESYWQINARFPDKKPFSDQEGVAIPDACRSGIFGGLRRYSLNGRPIQGAVNHDWTNINYKTDEGLSCPMSHGGVVNHYTETVLDQALQYGYKNSRLFNGETSRTTNKDGSKIPNNYDAVTQGIVNGDFERNKRFVTLDVEEPGFSEHGGDGFGRIENGFLTLGLNEDLISRNSIVHNRFYIPENVSSLRFEYYIDLPSNRVINQPDRLQVYLGSSLLKEIQLSSYRSGVENIDISAHANTVTTLKLEVITDGLQTNARVHIDNLFIELQDPINYKPLEPLVLNPDNNEEILTLTPEFEWSPFQHGGDNDTRIGYQLRVRSDSDDDKIVYDTGLIEDKTSLNHTYSSGSYTGTDALGQLRVSEQLEWGKQYHWHVRYRDSSGDWSIWSKDTEGDFQWFTTQEPVSPLVKVTSPNAENLVLHTGTVHSIKWETFNFSGDVKIELYQDRTLLQPIATVPGGVLSYEWNIPNDISTDINYSIRISSVEDVSIFDESDNTFLIYNEGEAPDPFISINSPNGGESWQKGSTQTIRWEDNISENVAIQLMLNGEVVTNISKSTESDGKFEWTLTHGYDTSNQYKIRVVSLNDEAIFGESENAFSITDSTSVKSYTVSLSANPTVGGTVTGAGTYEQNTSVSISAIPSEGYKFKNWTEDNEIITEDSLFDFIITENRFLTANFTQADSTKDSIDVSSPIILERFAITADIVEEGVNWDDAVNSIFGSNYRVADWNDLKTYHESGNNILALFDSLGLSDYNASVALKRNGNDIYSSSSSLTRYYFASRHEGNKPGHYLAHDNIDNFTISLGSWSGGRPLLAYRQSTGVEDSLVAYYPFNGNAKDESVNTNDGSVIGASLAVDRFGNPNSAYSFDGVDDYIVIDHSAEISSTEEMTISVFVKNDDLSQPIGRILSKKEGGGYSLDINRTTGEIFGQYAFDSGDGGVSFPISKIKEGGWHHFALTYDGEFVRFYLDGQVQDSLAKSGDILTNTECLVLGGEVKSGCEIDQNQFGELTLDDLRLFSKALSKQEIIKLFSEDGWTGNRIEPIEIHAPNLTIVEGDSLLIPIKVRKIGFSTIESYEFDLTYDPEIISIYSLETEGTQSGGSNVIVESNLGIPGNVLVTAAFEEVLPDSGTLINLKAIALKEGTSKLKWNSFYFNEGNPTVITENGLVVVEPLISCGDVTNNGSITNEDATFILRHVVKLLNLSAEDSVRADVTGNGWISAYDASQVLRYVVGKEHVFNCGNQNAKIVYTPVNASYSWVVQDSDSDEKSFIIPISISSETDFEAVDIEISFSEGVIFERLTDTPDNWLIGKNNRDNKLMVSMIGSEKPKNDQLALLEVSIDEDYGGAASITSSIRVNDNQKVDLAPILLQEIPSEFTLSQNYPNPFNPTTNISFTIPEQSDVQLVIFNVLGQKVAELVNGEKSPGSYTLSWDASSASSGVYIYQLKTSTQVISKRMLLIK
ncbi:MAG: LamG-like jellyroll fold domain-containing protein, partial [Balneola sp.]